MLQTGTVVDTAQGSLTVEFARPEACEKCGQCNGSRHATRLTLPGDAPLGAQVTVRMPEGKVAQASLLAYTVPLALMLGGLFAAGPLQPRIAPGWPADLFAALCAVLGLVLAGGALMLINRRIQDKRDWQPQIVDIQPMD